MELYSLENFPAHPHLLAPHLEIVFHKLISDVNGDLLGELRISHADGVYDSHETELKASLEVAYCGRSEARSFFNAIVAEWDLPHRHITSSKGRRDFPRGVVA